MAKACAYLCRQCCFIDGFGEFGEFGYSGTDYGLRIKIITMTNAVRNADLSPSYIVTELTCHRFDMSPIWSVADLTLYLSTYTELF